MAVDVLSAVAVCSAEVLAGQHAACEIGMACVDAGVDDAHHHAVALAVRVSFGDVEEAEMPFGVADRVGDRGAANVSAAMAPTRVDATACRSRFTGRVR